MKSKSKIESISIKELSPTRYIITSFTSDMKEYQVSIKKRQQEQKDPEIFKEDVLDFVCTCPANTTYKKNEWCKHIKAIVKYKMINDKKRNGNRE